MKNLCAWNKSLLAKTIWSIQEKKDNLWIKWVNQFYGSCGTIWTWVPNKETSPLIKQLISICQEMTFKLGTHDLAITMLSSWFNGVGGLSKAYDFFIGKVGRWPWKPLLWKTCILPKHRFILWLFSHGKLLSRDRQPYIDNKMCVLCDTQEESMAHLFFKCAKSKAIWTDIRQWLGMVKCMESARTILKAFRSTYRGNSYISKLRSNALAATIYQIWNARNRALFENEAPVVEDIVRKIQIVVLRCVPKHMDGVFEFEYGA